VACATRTATPGRCAWLRCARQCKLEVGERTVKGLPEGVAHDQERDVVCVGAAQDVVRVRFHHFAVGHDHRAAVEGFLFMVRPPISA